MSFASLHASATEVLTRFEAPTVGEDALRHALLAFLAAQPQGCARANVAGHITASVVILNEALSHVVLTHHPRVREWLQLGGHCEAEDATLVEAAEREGREESGLTSLILEPELLTLHAHPITCSLGQPTWHLDLRFRAIAPGPGTPPLVISEESTDLRWWPVDALPETAESTTVAQQVQAACARG